MVWGCRKLRSVVSSEVEERRQLYGMNQLPEPPPSSALVVFYAQFKSILIAILFGAALIVATIGDLKDAAVILAVGVINAFIGLFQEYRAERSLPESAD